MLLLCFCCYDNLPTQREPPTAYFRGACYSEVYCSKYDLLNILISETCVQILHKPAGGQWYLATPRYPTAHLREVQPRRRPRDPRQRLATHGLGPGGAHPH